MEMQMQSIQASFPSQEQAESAVRKLASLRGDCFRVECIGGSAQTGAYGSAMSAADYTFLHWGDTGAETRAGTYTLSANVPATAAEQARSVIQGAGGQML